jgi:hypothetical protein
VQTDRIMTTVRTRYMTPIQPAGTGGRTGNSEQASPISVGVKWMILRTANWLG